MQSPELFAEVSSFFKTYCHTSYQAIGVAVSGGSDSVALFFLLNRLKESLGIKKLAIIHINHGLRGRESDDDAAFVAQLAHDTGVPFFLKNLQAPLLPTGIENWARTERYAFFKHIRQTEDYDVVATGHTANDQAETVLMRMARGSGLKGLCAIAPVREDAIIRPLLSCSREQLRTWLAHSGITYREDSSNTDIVYRRNLIRHMVMPQLCAYNADAVVHLAGIARHAQAAWEVMAPLLTQWINVNVWVKSESLFSIRKEALLSDSLCREALAELFRASNIPFNQKHIESFLANTQKHFGQFLLCGGWSYRTIGSTVIVEKDYVEQPRYSTDPFCFELAVPGSTQCTVAGVEFVVEYVDSASLGTIDFDGKNMVVFLDAATLSGTLEYRSIVSEDRFVPLGIADSRNVVSFLRKQPMVTSLSFPVGVVTDASGKILWIPGVRIGNYCRITSKTTSIVKISCNLL